MLIGSLSRRGMHCSILPASAPVNPPVNTLPPVITSSGDINAPVNGDVLTVTDNGQWTGSPTFTYQWCRDNEANPIGGGGSTTISHTVNSDSLEDGGHTLLCVVTGTNAAGNASVNSNQTGPVAST